MPQKRQSPGQRGNATRASQQTTPHSSKHITAHGRFSPFARLVDPRFAKGILRQALPGSRLSTYSRGVTVNPVADLGRSSISRRTSAHHPIAGAFFVPAASCYGGCAWDSFGGAGCLESRSANPRTAVTIPCLAASGDGSSTLGATPMLHPHALNPSARFIRAAAHKAMALAALRANSSLPSRLARYNHHMQRARALESGEVCHG
ncbi:hypothetical protein D9M70_247310 [compost metagenome]